VSVQNRRAHALAPPPPGRSSSATASGAPVCGCWCPLLEKAESSGAARRTCSSPDKSSASPTAGRPAMGCAATRRDRASLLVERGAGAGGTGRDPPSTIGDTMAPLGFGVLVNEGENPGAAEPASLSSVLGVSENTLADPALRFSAFRRSFSAARPRLSYEAHVSVSTDSRTFLRACKHNATAPSRVPAWRAVNPTTTQYARGYPSSQAYPPGALRSSYAAARESVDQEQQP
jgi:hypothetical protein